MRKPKSGKPYKVRFYDHAIGDETGVICEIMAWYLHDDDAFHVFTTWLVDSEDEETVLDNLETTAIIKGTVIEFIPLE